VTRRTAHLLGVLARAAPYPVAVLALPRSVRLAAWGTAWLRGTGSLDGLPGAVTGDDDPHVVVGLPDPGGSTGLSTALVVLRRLGATGLRAALPVPGDPLGLPGPPALTESAVAAGEAVVAVGAPWALVPAIERYGPVGDQGTAVRWQAQPALDRPVDVPGVAEAERELAVAVREAAAELAALDVAGAGGPTLAGVGGLRSAAVPPLPAAAGPRADRLAASAVRLLAVLHLGGADGGAAVSAQQARRRAAGLGPLDRAARRALVAAAAAALEPVRD
jgi:hypothetical protein